MHRATSDGVSVSAMDYFKQCIWLPFLDAVINELCEKFSEQTQTAFSIIRVLRSSAVKSSDCHKVHELYGKQFDSTEEELFYELQMYHTYRTNCSVECDILSELKHIPLRFPLVKKCLQIAATIPVTTCSAERSFSTMKILKTRLRSTMLDTRLTGLALMYIHKDIDIPASEIISAFAKRNRKVDFVI